MIKLDSCPDWCTTDHTPDVHDEAFRFVCPDVLHRGPIDKAAGYTLDQCRTDLANQPDQVTEFDLEDRDGEQITLPADPDVLDQLAAMLTRTANRLRAD